MWGYRNHSDVASKVSSDGSSLIGSYFANPKHSADVQMQLLELSQEEKRCNYHDDDQDGDNEEGATIISDCGNEADDEVCMSSIDKDESLLTFTNETTIANTTSPCSSPDRRASKNNLPRSRKLPQRNIVGQRRQRAKVLHKSVVPSSSSSLALTSWQYVDRLQVGCLGTSNDENRKFRGDDDTVNVVVEATAICDLDFMMHRESSILDCGITGSCPSKEFVAGSNFVGVVHQVTKRSNKTGRGSEEEKSDAIPVGTRVAAILPEGGANARCISVPAHCLCVVPKQLDASEVCAILSTYLPAFSALHHGRSRPHRYSRSCLRGRTVLITGCTSLEAQAAVRLAEIAGSTHIYVTAPREYFSILHKHRPTILGENPDQWLPHVERKMDVVLDYQFPKHFPAVRAALARKGRLVCVSTTGYNMQGRPGDDQDDLQQNCCLPFEFLVEYCYLASMKRATLFSFADVVEESCDDQWQQDLEFLLHLLSTRQLRPDIDRFIGLNEVAKARSDIFKRPLYGSIICEPWKT
ncbi:hypothetical protein ACA910_012320 [Epithemia clementina (nom. ined.)]